MYYSKCNAGFVLRLEMGEEVQESLRHFAHDVELQGAFYQGIGVLAQVELAFFHSEEQRFERSYFEDEYELISLSGNLSFSDGTFEPHTHVCLGSRNFQTISGHLVRATVSVTAELLLTPVDLSLSRKDDLVFNYKGLVIPNCSQLKVHF